MKKLTLLFLITFLPLMASADTLIDGIYYNLLTKAKLATVTSGRILNKSCVTIPEIVTYDGVTYNVTSIGNSAFSYCSKLTSVNIPNSVTSIGYAAFSHCSGLTSLIIPNSVTSIGESAFSGCSGLTSITMSDSAQSIGDSTFDSCSSLTSVTIPNSVTTIGISAFYGCSSLISVSIGKNVKTIGNYAFHNCSKLTSVNIPNSVTSIGFGAFSWCSELTDVYCHAENVPTISSDAFENSYIEYTTLYVPEASINAYKTAEPWSGFGKIKTLSEEMPETPKCATPTIEYVNGQITFSCETEDVEFVYDIISSISGEGANVALPTITTYKVTVYATKDGFENSDVATKEIEVGGTSSGIRGDVNLDNEIGMPDVMFIVNYILNGKFPDEE